MSGNVDFNALFSLFTPQDAELFAQEQVDALGGTGFRYSFTHFPDVSIDPETLNGNGLIMNQGWWNVKRPFSMFANEVRFTKAWEDVGNQATLGLYFSDYSSDEVWNFNDVLLEARDQPRLMDLVVTGVPGEGEVRVTNNGFTQYGDFYRNASNNGHVLAAWLQDQYQATDRLALDLGLRFEFHALDGNSEELGSFDLGGPTLADDNFTWGTGNFIPYSFNYEEFAVSGGANYDIRADELAVFARGTSGYRIPDFDQFTEQTAGDGINSITEVEPEDVLQFEGGVKFSSPMVGAFVTAFWSQLTNVPFSDEVIDPETGETVTLSVLSDAETLGVEAEVIAEPAEGLRLDLNATLQNPETTNIRFTSDDPPDVETGTFDGNQIRRIPEFIFQFTPSYEFPIEGTAGLQLFGTFFATGERFTDFANNTALPSYTRIDLGFRAPISERVAFEGHLFNTANTIGLTEGNPRVGQVVGVQEDIFMARPILGRSFRASVSYNF